MTNKTVCMSDTLHAYLLHVSSREDGILARLREETARHPLARMQIAPEQGQLINLLVRLIGAERAVEIGVFTGYSSIAIARGLGPQGRLIACDTSEEYTRTARRYWREAELEDRVELRLGPALSTLDALHEEGWTGTVDFAFVDADKTEYIDYYESLLPLLRTGGLIAVDNTLWSGRVADHTDSDEDTVAIRAFNDHVKNDERVDLSLIPIGDGLTLLHKR